MSLENFKLSSKNPNDTTGGGGCLCHPHGKPTGACGPYVIFHAACTDEPLSPHAVMCAGCVRAANKKVILADYPESEVLNAGEDVLSESEVRSAEEN